MIPLLLEPLTPQAFAPFGDVIQRQGNDSFPINQGSTQRYHDLGSIQVAGQGGRAAISVAVGDAFAFPITIRLLERHPLGSQAWLPWNRLPYVVVVAPNGADDTPDETQLRAFLAQGDQGVNYHAGTWHHPLLSLHDGSEFIVVDRLGNEPNCDEINLQRTYSIQGADTIQPTP